MSKIYLVELLGENSVTKVKCLNPENFFKVIETPIINYLGYRKVIVEGDREEFRDYVGMKAIEAFDEIDLRKANMGWIFEERKPYEFYNRKLISGIFRQFDTDDWSEKFDLVKDVSGKLHNFLSNVYNPKSEINLFYLEILEDEIKSLEEEYSLTSLRKRKFKVEETNLVSKFEKSNLEGIIFPENSLTSEVISKTNSHLLNRYENHIRKNIDPTFNK